MKRILVLIPARYQSSRFPGKPLAKICGLSMIERVYKSVEGISDSYEFAPYVVTDDERIENEVKRFGGNVLRVDDNVSSGSERIYLAYRRHLHEEQWDLIINVQGDEPLLKPDVLKKIAEFHLKSKYDVATVVKKRFDLDELNDPNRVKVAFVPTNGQCLYFSRSAIPHCREGNLNHWHLHIGIYSYKVEALESFFNLNQSYYEQTEKLEQLRLLENEMTIGAIESDIELIGVDTPEDIKKVEGVLSVKK